MTASLTILIEEYEFLTSQGLTLEEVAAKLGLKPASLKKALARDAKATG